MDLQLETLDEMDVPLSVWEGLAIVGGAIVVGGAVGAGIAIIT